MFAQDHRDGESAEARSTTPAVMELMLGLGAIRDFGAACREMIDLVERQIVSEDRRTAEEIASADPFASGASSDERALVHKLFADIERDMAEVVDAVTDADLDRVGHVGDPFGLLLSLIPFDRLRVRLIGLADGALASMPGALGYASVYMAALMRRPRQPLLLRALLAAVCSQAEADVARILRRALYTKGGFSRYDSVDLDEAVQAHLRGGLAKWRRVILAELNMDLQALSADWPACEEVFLRRNLLVHRGGIVNSTYQQKADPSAAIGTRLDVDAAYLSRAVDLTETLTFALAATYLLTHQPDLSTRLSGAANELGDDAARRGRMLLAQGYHHVAGSLTYDPIEQARARVECWLDRDGRVEPRSIRDEVMEWDTSDLPPEFELARQILLGEDDAALKLLHHLRETNHITDEDVAGWRLFRSLRDRGFVSTPASIPRSDENSPADVELSG